MEKAPNHWDYIVSSPWDAGQYRLVAVSIIVIVCALIVRFLAWKDEAAYVPRNMPPPVDYAQLLRTQVKIPADQLDQGHARNDPRLSQKIKIGAEE